MKVGFISLGCPKNQVDTEIMIGKLKNVGYIIVNEPNKAELIIINTCGFINEAKEEAINTIINTARLKTEGRLQYLVATGCLVQRYGKELLDEMPELDGVVGISSFTDIDKILVKVCNGERVAEISQPATEFFEKGPRIITTPAGSAYLKVSEGCNNRCAYCAIPLIRGNLRSRPILELVDEGQQLVGKGIKELVLIGQDTGMYGLDLRDGSNISNLLQKLTKIEGLEWIRLMYLHPQHINNQLIEIIQTDKKVLPYLDIPVQHADNRVLKQMNRRHNTDELYLLLHRLKAEIKDLVLRTTVMAGFPGESDQEFQVLYDFINDIELDWLGAFIFNPEEGTPAFNMPDQIPEEIKTERRDAIMKLQAVITRKKNMTRINKRDKILVSSQISNNLYLGRGYFQAPDVDGVTMVKSSNKIDKGSFVNVSFKGIRNYDMIGECLDEYSK